MGMVGRDGRYAEIKDRVARRVCELSSRNSTTSRYYDHLQQALCSGAISSPGAGRFDLLVCYGLGPICRSVISQHQLALFLFLARCLSPGGAGCRSDARPLTVVAYDPVFDADDRAVLADLGIEQCAFPLSSNGALVGATWTRLFLFMPHCELDVYERALRDLQALSVLHRTVLLGNRLARLIDGNPPADDPEDPQAIRNGAQSLLSARTVRLPNELYCWREDVFNDCFLHWFSAPDKAP